jgi:hypothetical protein
VLSEQWSERLENSMRVTGNELSTHKNHRKAFRQQADSIFRTFVTVAEASGLCICNFVP